MSGRRFTKEEDKQIIREIRLSPTNLQAAFLKAAFKLNRTKESIEKRYYNYLRNRANSLFFLFTPNKLATNCKNTWRGRKYSKKRVTTIRNKWKAILDVLFD